MKSRTERKTQLEYTFKLDLANNCAAWLKARFTCRKEIDVKLRPKTLISATIIPTVDLSMEHEFRTIMTVLMSCLGEDLSPASWLESLKLYGPLDKLTDCIHQLQNICKLVLEFSYLEQTWCHTSPWGATKSCSPTPEAQAILGETTPFPKLGFPESWGARALLLRLPRIDAVLRRHNA
jgi:hypothetical protein